MGSVLRSVPRRRRNLGEHIVHAAKDLMFHCFGACKPRKEHQHDYEAREPMMVPANGNRRYGDGDGPIMARGGRSSQV
jgi:hypothetical protein